MEAEASAPAPLWSIALVSLAPFPISTVLYAYGPAAIADLALTAAITWSAMVLSFLGGVRWGLESSRPAPRFLRLMASVMSSVAAWGLLMARDRISAAWLLGGFIAAFILQWLFDHAAPDVPARYPRLSTVLTGGACVSLAMALEHALRM